MKSKVGTFTLLVGVLLAGCGSAPPSKETVATAKVCCASFAELKFIDLKPGETIAESIDASSQLFQFSDGRSYTLAVAIGPAPNSRRLLIKSYLSGSWLPSATMFYPKVQLLGANRTPSGPALSVRVAQGNDFFKGGYYATVIDLRPEEHFVVLYSDPETHGKSLPRYNSPAGLTYPLAGSMVTIQGTGATHMIPSVSAGRLELTLSK
jgi:hypothetical protein